MEKKEKFKYKEYLIVSTVITIIAYFVYSGGLKTLGHAIIPLLIGLTIAYILNPLVNSIQKNLRLGRTGSVVLSYVFIFLAILLIIGVTIPVFGATGQYLERHIAVNSKSDFQQSLLNLPFIPKSWDLSKLNTVADSLRVYIEGNIQNLTENIYKLLDSLKTFVLNVVLFCLGFIISFYALRDLGNFRGKTYKLIRSIFPEKDSSRIINVLKSSDELMKKYIVGRIYLSISLMVLMTMLTYIASALTDIFVPFIPLIAMIVSLGAFIPYIGPLVSLIIVLLISSLYGVSSVIIVLIIFILVNTITYLYNKRKRKNKSEFLKGFWVLIAIVVGGSIFGLVGVLFSVPAVAIILSLVIEYRDRHDHKLIEDIKYEIIKFQDKKKEK